MAKELTPEEFSEKYDELYQQALAVFAEYNPCKIEDCSDGEHKTCARGRLHDRESFCCYGCEHLSDDGCTVECLWCKLWFCQGPPNSQYDKYRGKLLNVPYEFFTKLGALRVEAEGLGMIAYRCSKERLMEERYGTMDSAVRVLRAG